MEPTNNTTYQTLQNKGEEWYRYHGNTRERMRVREKWAMH